MMKLYFSPGACSMASHIGLEECGEPYTEQPTLLGKGEHRTEAYLKINPRGKVPALEVDGQIIVENTAILTYLHRLFPEKKLLPAAPLEEVRAISLMAWFSNTVHPAYTHTIRPERWVDGDECKASVKEKNTKTFWDGLSEIDSLLNGKEWMMGSQFTYVDGYALVFYGWGTRAGMKMAELKDYTRWKDRMLARPKVRKVLESEGNVLVKQ
jgi:glutathione S-transferase